MPAAITFKTMNHLLHMLFYLCLSGKARRTFVCTSQPREKEKPPLRGRRRRLQRTPTCRGSSVRRCCSFRREYHDGRSGRAAGTGWRLLGVGETTMYRKVFGYWEIERYFLLWYMVGCWYTLKKIAVYFFFLFLIMFLVRKGQTSTQRLIGSDLIIWRRSAGCCAVYPAQQHENITKPVLTGKDYCWRFEKK